MADRVGFEPTVGFHPRQVFKKANARSFSHNLASIFRAEHCESWRGKNAAGGAVISNGHFEGHLPQNDGARTAICFRTNCIAEKVRFRLANALFGRGICALVHIAFMACLDDIRLREFCRGACMFGVNAGDLDDCRRRL